MAYELRLLWHTNPDFYALWLVLLGVGMVFNRLTIALACFREVAALCASCIAAHGGLQGQGEKGVGGPGEKALATRPKHEL